MLGVNLDDADYLIIRFGTPQTIDSIVVLADSNVKFYTVSYTKPNGDEYVLEEVRHGLKRLRFRSIERM